MATEDTLDAIGQYVTRKVTKACRLAVDLDVSPRMVLRPHISLDTMMLSAESEKDLPGLERADDVLIPMEENSRVKQLAEKARFGLDASGKVLKESKAVSYRDAIFEPLIHHMYHDSRVVAYGEENRDWGGAFAVYRGMTESFSLPPGLQHAHLGGRDCGQRGWVCP